MARIRSVHPGLFTDEAFVSLSSDAQILLVGIWTECDDQGVFEWKPITLRMRLRPTKDGPIEPLLAELEAVNAVKRYEHGGRQFGLVRNFRKYQTPKSPKFTHFMPPDFRTYVGLGGGASEIDGDEVGLFPQNGEIAPLMEGRGEEGERREGEREGANAPPGPARASRLPEGWQPTEADVKRAYADGLDEREVRREFEKFTDYWRAKPGKGGTKLDWNATYRIWMGKAADDKHARNGRLQQGQSAAARH